MNEALLQRLRQSLAQREGSSLRRKLTARASSDKRVNLADNDYLGLSHDPAVIAAGVAALQEWGASASASPLVTGYTEIHQKLEQTLAASWIPLLGESGRGEKSARFHFLPR